jgi:hypothetical protein
LSERWVRADRLGSLATRIEISQAPMRKISHQALWTVRICNVAQRGLLQQHLERSSPDCNVAPYRLSAGGSQRTTLQKYYFLPGQFIQRNSGVSTALSRSDSQNDIHSVDEIDYPILRNGFLLILKALYCSASFNILQRT